MNLKADVNGCWNILNGKPVIQIEIRNSSFGKRENHAIEIYSEKFLWTKINYIHNNPVEEELVKEPFEYLYLSASNYYLGEGLLEEVFCIPPMLKKY